MFNIYPLPQPKLWTFHLSKKHIFRLCVNIGRNNKLQMLQNSVAKLSLSNCRKTLLIKNYVNCTGWILKPESHSQQYPEILCLSIKESDKRQRENIKLEEQSYQSVYGGIIFNVSMHCLTLSWWWKTLIIW